MSIVEDLNREPAPGSVAAISSTAYDGWACRLTLPRRLGLDVMGDPGLDRPPSGVASMALIRRLSNTWRRWSMSASMIVGASGNLVRNLDRLETGLCAPRDSGSVPPPGPFEDPFLDFQAASRSSRTLESNAPAG